MSAWQLFLKAGLFFIQGAIVLHLQFEVPPISLLKNKQLSIFSLATETNSVLDMWLTQFLWSTKPTWQKNHCAECWWLYQYDGTPHKDDICFWYNFLSMKCHWEEDFPLHHQGESVHCRQSHSSEQTHLNIMTASLLCHNWLAGPAW